MVASYKKHHLIRHKLWSFLARNSCCYKNPEPEHMYKDCTLYIEDETAPEPEDVNWDSYEVRGCRQVGRVFFAAFIIFCFLVISCSIIGVGCTYISSQAHDCDDVDFTKSLE